MYFAPGLGVLSLPALVIPSMISSRFRPIGSAVWALQYDLPKPCPTLITILDLKSFPKKMQPEGDSNHHANHLHHTEDGGVLQRQM